jgi:hypothetical protein
MMGLEAQALENLLNLVQDVAARAREIARAALWETPDHVVIEGAPRQQLT